MATSIFRLMITSICYFCNTYPSFVDAARHGKHLVLVYFFFNNLLLVMVTAAMMMRMITINDHDDDDDDDDDCLIPFYLITF